ncbi:MAG: hypothetical protein IJM75_09185 [Ruminococcus sp.]|nr:hypothetical protein [Ruminococcus sp.]
MKLRAKAKLFISSSICGVIFSLWFTSAFDVFVMLAFNETSKHPVEYPMMLIVTLVTVFILFLLLYLNIRVLLRFERNGKMIIADIAAFVISALVSYLPWCFVLWLFDSDAQIIG